MQGVSCHRLLCLSVTGRGSRGSLVHLSWLVVGVGEAGEVAAALAVAEDSMLTPGADSLPGEKRRFVLLSLIVKSVVT